MDVPDFNRICETEENAETIRLNKEKSKCNGGGGTVSTSGRLTEVYGKAKRICYSTGEKFVIMSDCHRGVGTLGDNFLKNRHIFLTALRYYYRRGFSYVELGDGEELWENKEPEEVLATHREVYRVLEDFHRDGRLYMLFGNHDIQKKKDGYFKDYCS